MTLQESKILLKEIIGSSVINCYRDFHLAKNKQIPKDLIDQESDGVIVLEFSNNITLEFK